MNNQEQYEAIKQPYAQKRDNLQQYNFNCYEQAEFLGEGAFGEVIKVYRSFIEYENGPVLKWPYACKIQSKKDLQKMKIQGQDEDGMPCFLNGLQILKQEIEIYKNLDCKNICKLFEYIYDDDEIGDYPDQTFQILQYCDLGELMTWNQLEKSFKRNQKLEKFIQEKYNIGLGIGSGYGVQPSLGIGTQYEYGINKQHNLIIREQLAKVIFKQVLQAIIYLHNKRIANRDIKPQNILCKSYDELKGHHIKLADFGLAIKLDDQEDLIMTPGGTPGIQSPEQASGDEYNPFQSDIWCLGVTLFSFLTEKLPWLSDQENLDLYWEQQAEKGQVQWQLISDYSQELQQILQSCIQINPNQRPTAQQLITNKWFKII